MIFERFEKLRDGTFLRPQEVQTELAEWEQVGPRSWQRKMREWRVP